MIMNFEWLLGGAQAAQFAQAAQSAQFAQAAMALYQPPSASPPLEMRKTHADTAYRAKNFSQGWLNAMLDVELGSPCLG